MVWQKQEDAEENTAEVKSGKLKKLHFTYISFLLTSCFWWTSKLLFICFLMNVTHSQAVINKEKSDSRWNPPQPMLRENTWFFWARWDAIGLFARIRWVFFFNVTYNVEKKKDENIFSSLKTWLLQGNACCLCSYFS